MANELMNEMLAERFKAFVLKHSFDIEEEKENNDIIALDGQNFGEAIEVNKSDS